VESGERRGQSPAFLFAGHIGCTAATMPESQNPKPDGEYDEEFASTSNQDRATADDRASDTPEPQGGKGNPSKAEGEDPEEE
jgi:hypothetical protein